VATSAQTFHQQYHIGRRVQEAASPHRKGSIRAVRGSGANAQITVALDGRPPANFRPAQLTLL
jgi:hypothetical protein